jgi:hypothetical protein
MAPVPSLGTHGDGHDDSALNNNSNDSNDSNDATNNSNNDFDDLNRANNNFSNDYDDANDFNNDNDFKDGTPSGNARDDSALEGTSFKFS